MKIAKYSIGTGSYAMAFIMITLISVVGLGLILFLKPISPKMQALKQ